MTALVSVLNTHAVALAADSAITINRPGNRKVHNGGNKLFALSKYHPVGIMYCGNCDFMDTPLEVIIKMYRDHIGHKDFDTIEDYRNDFIKYILDNDFFCSKERQNFWLTVEALKFCNIIMILTAKQTNAPVGSEEYVNEFEKQLKKVKEDKSKTCHGYATIDNDYLHEAAKVTCPKVFVDKNNKAIFASRQDLSTLFSDAFANFIRRGNSNIDHSELVFAGFGHSQILPAASSVNIYFGYNKVLRYQNGLSIKLEGDYKAEILKAGQRDMMDTVTTGIHTHIENQLRDILIHSLEPIIKDIPLQGIAENVRQKALIKVIANFEKQLQTLKQNFTKPIVDSVSTLDKEDLAILAESLISVTAINRRITYAEESVGGPIDVAVISKSDGFIWIKRKHYFDGKLNPQFFSNYYNHEK